MTLSVPLLLNPSFLSLHACLCWQFALLQLLLSSPLHCSIFGVQFLFFSDSKGSCIILISIPGIQQYFGSPPWFLPIPSCACNNQLVCLPLWSLNISYFLHKVHCIFIIRKINSVTLFMFISTNLIMKFVLFFLPLSFFDTKFRGFFFSCQWEP